MVRNHGARGGLRMDERSRGRTASAVEAIKSFPRILDCPRILANLTIIIFTYLLYATFLFLLFKCVLFFPFFWSVWGLGSDYDQGWYPRRADLTHIWLYAVKWASVAKLDPIGLLRAAIQASRSYTHLALCRKGSSVAKLDSPGFFMATIQASRSYTHLTLCSTMIKSSKTWIEWFLGGWYWGRWRLFDNEVWRRNTSEISYNLRVEAAKGPRQIIVDEILGSDEYFNLSLEIDYQWVWFKGSLSESVRASLSEG